MKLNKRLPPILPGSKVGLVTPAGPATKEQIQNGLDTLTKFDVQYEFGKHAFSDEGMVAASAAKRLEDIHGFLKRKDIDAIWALRGGYGSIQLLDKFDYSLLRQHPKLMIGFSDLTAFQWAVYKQTGLPSVSGFTLTSQLCPENPFVEPGMEILSGERTSIFEKDLQEARIQVIHPGEAEGILLGGTLSMIGSLCGTPYFVNRDDLILYLDEINEAPYRIDRYLQQMALMNFWSKVKGVILGQFIDEGKELEVASLLSPLLPPSIPVISNFPYGHSVKCIPMPQGVLANFKAESFHLTWNAFIAERRILAAQS